MGLDPVARRSLVESMVYLTRRSDRTILFSSHQLEDVERVSDYVAILDHSILRASCSLDTFRASMQQVRLRFTGAPPPLPPIHGLVQAQRTENELRLVCVRFDQQAEQTLRALNPAQMEVEAMALEDAFISYLGERGEKSFILAGAEEQP